MLAHTFKEYEWGVDRAVDSFIQRTLPVAEDLVLGLDDDYAVGVWNRNWDVPSAVWSKVVRLLFVSPSARTHRRALSSR